MSKRCGQCRIVGKNSNVNFPTGKNVQIEYISGNYVEHSSILLLDIQVCKDDPLPKRVCIQCQQDVYVFHNKIKRFQMLESKWCDILKEEKPNHPYLELIDLYDVSLTLKLIVDSYILKKTRTVLLFLRNFFFRFK